MTKRLGGRAGRVTIGQLMQPEVYSVDADASASDAAALMWQNHVGAVPVVEEGGTLIGIITDRDIAMAAYRRGKTPADIPVSSMMSKDVISAHAGDSIHAVSALMSRRQVRRVPIVDDKDKLIGIVSVNDLALAATEAAADGEISEHELADTLRAISAARPPAEWDLSAN